MAIAEKPYLACAHSWYKTYINKIPVATDEMFYKLHLQPTTSMYWTIMAILLYMSKTSTMQVTSAIYKVSIFI